MRSNPTNPPLPGPPSDWTRELRDHLALCQDLLAVVEQESQWLRQGRAEGLNALVPAKRALLDRLRHSRERLRLLRARWQQCPPEQRAALPEVPALLRQNQQLSMRILLLDRENEQGLLRLGLLPAQHLPTALHQQPAAVLARYQRPFSTL